MDSVVYCRKFRAGLSQSQSTLYLSKQQSTQPGRYTIAACFPFEPLEKCMTFKDIFPGLSGTRSFNFQDFPEPKWFSRSWNLEEKNPGLSSRCGNPERGACSVEKQLRTQSADKRLALILTFAQLAAPNITQPHYYMNSSRSYTEKTPSTRTIRTHNERTSTSNGLYY